MEQRDIERQLRRELQLTQGSTFLSDALNFRRIEFGHRPSNTTSSIVHLTFSISVQPLFHKNFDLLQQTFADYLSQGYKIYICADSQKQNERLKDILADSANISFNPVDKTLHEGFIDRDLRICVFTDHQIFDRFHKYNLRSDSRSRRSSSSRSATSWFTSITAWASSVVWCVCLRATAIRR